MVSLGSMFQAITLALTTFQYPTFEQWRGMYNVTYPSQSESEYRSWVYDQNVRRIAIHNTEGHSWTMGVNRFADLTADEFGARFTGGYRAQNYSYGTHDHMAETWYGALPGSVDWTQKGAVTPVKNQEQCGSCWAFSTTGAVEGAWFLAKGQLVSLSEQELVDCSTASGNEGCNGGLMDYAFQYIIDNKGISSESAYPYTATGPNQCKAAGLPIAATITGYKDVAANSETALLTAVAQQPVSVAVEADQSSFQFYSGGVMTAACGTNLDHGVLAVGYGTDSSGQDYWKVKNSWGADWGMNGYILLGRGSKFNPSGQCGIQMQPSYPVV